VQTYYIACDSVNLQPASSSSTATVSECSAPYWATSPGLLPPLGATGGVEIGLGILVCWAVAAGFRSLISQIG